MVGPPPQAPALRTMSTNDRVAGIGSAGKGSGRPAAAPAERGLDWLNLFVANIQTGFGPFIAVYLTTQGWTQTSIGLALSLGTVAAMASQIPAGALVDAIRGKAWVGSSASSPSAPARLLFAVQPAPLCGVRRRDPARLFELHAWARPSPR